MSQFRIFKCDAFDWLAERRASSVHAIVTDPPFGLVEFDADQLAKRRSGNGGIWRLPQNYDGAKRSPTPRFTVLGDKDHERIRLFHEKLGSALHRVLVPGGHVLIASQNLLSHIVISGFCGAGFELRGQIVREVRTLRGGDRPKGAHERYPNISVSPRGCWEPWIIFRKVCEGKISDNLDKWKTGALRRPHDGSPFCDLIRSSPARGLEREIAPHPSLKPQAFMRQVVRASLPLSRGIVLDPFMGSGSTIGAAVHLGIYAIGLEKNREYFRIAKKAIPSLAAIVRNGAL